MSKVRVVIAEMEGTDSAVLEAIRLCVSSGGGAASVNAPPVEPQPEIVWSTAQVELPEPKQLRDDPPPPKAAKPAKPPKSVKPPKSIGPAGLVREETDGAVGPSQRAVLDVLKKGPLTSGECIQKLSGSMSAPAVYTVLGALRKIGRIKSEQDQADGIRKNFIV